MPGYEKAILAKVNAMCGCGVDGADLKQAPGAQQYEPGAGGLAEKQELGEFDSGADAHLLEDA